MRLSPLCLPFFIALSCSLASAAGAEDYEIKFFRPATVGDRYGVVVIDTTKTHVTGTVGGLPVLKDNAQNVSMIAKAEVLDTTPAGREAKTRFTIARLTNTIADQRDEILPPGTEVVAENVGAEVTFRIAGAAASANVAQILKAAIGLRSDDETWDRDAILGTKERKKVGDAWPASVAAVANKLKIAAENVSGTTTLNEVTNGAMTVDSSLTINQVELPPGMTSGSGVMVLHQSGILPIDTTKRAKHLGRTMEVQMECAGKKGDKDMALTMTIEKVRDTTFTAP